MKLAAPLRTLGRLVSLTAPLWLFGCGGGGGDSGSTNATDPLAEQKSWLAAYMNDQYFWYALKPTPDPLASSTIASYFTALLYTGTSAEFPADRWSYSEPTASYQQFFGAGQVFGYGVAVAGLEVAGQPTKPLRVRYVEPASPAAGLVQRGETLLTINGTPASNFIASGDFSVLTAVNATDTLVLTVRGTSGDRQVTIPAAVYTLTPVSVVATLASPNGKPVGYVMLHDFISQASTPFDAALAQFKAAGVTEAVLDLRYNGGGLVSVADGVASDFIAPSAVGQPFVKLSFNDKHAASNTTYTFSSQAAALGLSRVYVLTGARTCSASELVVNGLKPFVTVVQIGDTTCGKPVGFQPVDHEGTTFSAVNFESHNAADVGRYWSGLAPTCAVADDVDHALGDAAEGLIAAALSHVDTGACPVASARDQPQALRARAPRVIEPDRSRGMIAR